MADTSIEWTDKTWNPIRGCSRVSDGCTRCYAEGQAHRFSGPGKPYEGLTKMTSHGVAWTGKVITVPEMLGVPLQWKKPARIFVNSMSDLFHESIPEKFIAEVFGVMAVCGAREPGDPERGGQFGGKYSKKRGWHNLKGPHTFQVLTKRPERMHSLLTSSRFREAVASAAYRWAHNQRDAGYLAHQIGQREEYARCYPPGRMWPLSNVWLGVSVEDQATADERIPLLLQTPAAVRWISAEPLLGPIDFEALPCGDALHTCEGCRDTGVDDGTPCTLCAGLGRLHWVVTGGESGPKARPSHPDWFRSLRDQCAAAAVPFLFKQHGAWVQCDTEVHADERGHEVYPREESLLDTLPPDRKYTVIEAHGAEFMKLGKKTAGRTLDGRTHEEYPA